MKHNLKENAYLLTASNMAVLQKLLETEWEPLGYHIAASNLIFQLRILVIILLENIFTLVVSVYILMMVIMLLI